MTVSTLTNVAGIKKGIKFVQSTMTALTLTTATTVPVPMDSPPKQMVTVSILTNVDLELIHVVTTKSVTTPTEATTANATRAT